MNKSDFFDSVIEWLAGPLRRGSPMEAVRRGRVQRRKPWTLLRISVDVLFHFRLRTRNCLRVQCWCRDAKVQRWGAAVYAGWWFGRVARHDAYVIMRYQTTRHVVATSPSRWFKLSAYSGSDPDGLSALGTSFMPSHASSQRHGGIHTSGLGCVVEGATRCRRLGHTCTHHCPISQWNDVSGLPLCSRCHKRKP